MTTEQIPPNLGTSSSSSDTSQPETKRDPKEDAKLVSWLTEQFRQAKQSRWRDERQWFINLAMYFGKQNISVLNTPGGTQNYRLYTPPAPYYRARPIVNRIRPLIRTEVSKLTSQKPSAFVVPASSEDRDLYAANAGEQIWDSLYHQKHLHKVLRRAVWWASVTGNGFIKSWWDDDVVDPNAGVYGDICYEAITPFHIFVADTKLSDIEDQPMVMHAVNQSIEKLEMIYGKKISQSNSENEIDEKFASAMGIDNSNPKKPDTVLVIEAWIKPNHYKMFPDGGLITVAGTQVLSVTEGWPYEHNKYPFAHIQHVETGKFYAESTITDLIPLQREYNRTRGQIIESKNRMAKPQLAAEMGSIDVTKLTSEPGQVVLYRPGFQAPQPIPLQSLPSYVLEEQDRIKMDMDEISGQHEVSRGQAPAGVTAATAIAYLQEQDDTKLSSTYDSIEESMEKLAHMTLVYVKQFWDTPRMIKVTGADQSFDVLAFQGSDLRDNTDIRMEAGSALPTSRAAKQAFVMDLMKMGFIDPNKGLEVMEIGGINKIYEQVQVDVRQAQRENLRMAQVNEQMLMQHEQAEMMKLEEDPLFQQKMQANMIMQSPDGELIDISMMATGQGPPIPVEVPLIVPVNSWDDHRLHIEKHNAYRKSQSFENLPPEAKELFDAHVNAHIQAIMVGAQGAMGLSPEVLAMSNNPETMSEMTYREAAEQPGAGPTAPPEQQSDPSMGMEQM